MSVFAILFLVPSTAAANAISVLLFAGSNGGVLYLVECVTDYVE